VKTHRFQSPFEHWVSGLAAEIVAFAAFLAVLAGLIAALAWML
jgi:hypothetical protein